MSVKKIKPFDALNMTNLANGRVSLKLKYLVLVKKKKKKNFSLCSDFILNLYKVYELNNWPHNPINNFTLKIISFMQSNEEVM